MRSPTRPRRPGAARRSPAGAPSPAAAVDNGDGAEPRFVARLVPLDPGLYAFSLAAETGWREPVAGLALPAVQVSAPPHSNGAAAGAIGGAAEGAIGKAIEITDSSGRAGAWLGGRHKVLFVKIPAGGGTALVTGYLARDPNSLPLQLDIRRLGLSAATPPAGTPPAAPGVAAGGPVVRLTIGGPVADEQSPQPTGLDIVAHIRGRGDVRFLDTPWVGRLGGGMWIEAFVILPHRRSADAAIEYKGLTASGAETPWTGSGALCGARGQGVPLIGFAVRQKAVPGGALVDCEYTGYFQSGAVAGPARNGAPCRSAIENDPLEGMQLRITPRPAAAAPPGPAGAETA